MIRSEYSYDRNIVRDIARALADMRSQVPGSHLGTLYRIDVAIADAIFIDDSEGAMLFLTRCKIFTDLPGPQLEGASGTTAHDRGLPAGQEEQTSHQPPRGESPCLTQPSRSAGT